MLKFYPHRWREDATLAGLATLAANVSEDANLAVPQKTERKAEDTSQSADSPENDIPAWQPAKVAKVANPAAVLREWHGHLSRIDQLRAPDGWVLNEWLTLTDDACWLYENHAGYAVRNGWDANGLFGVRIGMPECGGLAQFLRSSRKVLFDGPIAHVTLFGVTSRISPACGNDLLPLWEI